MRQTAPTRNSRALLTVGCLVLASLTGCETISPTALRDRPTIRPATDLQTERRDIRALLPIPDDELGIETGFVPRDARYSRSW